MPATTSNGPAASSSQGPRTVLSLPNSLRMLGSTGSLLSSGVVVRSRNADSSAPCVGPMSLSGPANRSSPALTITT